ncbi:hypothetical protein IW261DRAFT_1575731 [Armillaria novae-zelandiae]|uniref:Uncharacterized protein n=1 Tax=Armillaria novae-zelandiae TaxID=153914 RepID=A0AA39TQW8_9AGAR|nr:hypothetical protein IW261DRAFT_1575731 [Armillaria novae-zelandiae]
MSLPQIPMDQQLDAPSNQAPLSNVSPKLASVIRDNFLTGASPTRCINFNFLNVPSDPSEGGNVPAFEVPSSQSSSQNVEDSKVPLARGTEAEVEIKARLMSADQDILRKQNEIDTLTQENLILQQEASDLRKHTQTHPAKLAELIATHSTETASLKHQRNTQLEAALKHHMHEVDQLHSKLDVSEEVCAAAGNNEAMSSNNASRWKSRDGLNLINYSNKG